MRRDSRQSRPKWHINRIIQLWFRFGSKFYFAQTDERDFEVRLIYSPRYRDIVFQYDYPDFVKFYKYEKDPALQTWRNLDDVPRPCLVHRVDADDQYCIDFFRQVEKRANTIYKPQHQALLHTRYIQFDMRTRLTSPVQHMPCPHFVTVRLLDGQTLPATADPLHTKQHNVPKRFKTVGSGNVTLALEGLHGGNWVNRWFGGNKGMLLPHKRFAYFGDQQTDSTAIGPHPPKSSNK